MTLEGCLERSDLQKASLVQDKHTRQRPTPHLDFTWEPSLPNPSGNCTLSLLPPPPKKCNWHLFSLCKTFLPISLCWSTLLCVRYPYVCVCSTPYRGSTGFIIEAIPRLMGWTSSCTITKCVYH